MLTALKWSGTSVTVGSLAAATPVRVIAGGAGGGLGAPGRWSGRGLCGPGVGKRHRTEQQQSGCPELHDCLPGSADHRSTIRAPNASWNDRPLRAAIGRKAGAKVERN